MILLVQLRIAPQNPKTPSIVILIAHERICQLICLMKMCYDNF